MNSSLANHDCAATLEMCTLHKITNANFQFHCIVTISKGGDGAKGSNSLLHFGAWDVLIEDKIGKVSPEGFWKKPQSENAVQHLVMWDSLFCVTRFPSNSTQLKSTPCQNSSQLTTSSFNYVCMGQTQTYQLPQDRVGEFWSWMVKQAPRTSSPPQSKSTAHPWIFHLPY